MPPKVSKEVSEDLNVKLVEAIALLQQSMQVQAENMKAQAENMKAQAERHDKAIEALTQRLSSGEPTSSSDNSSKLMSELGGRIAQFVFDLEGEKTFSKWYARYGTAITVDGASLSDEQKVSLLIGKLSDEVYDQYTKRICPQEFDKVEFKDTVDILKEMFDIKKSLFSHRFACINITREGETPVEYTNKVNALCEAAMLKDIDAEGWKVFFWLRGLDPKTDQKQLAYFLKYVEQKLEQKQKVNINDLCSEWQKYLRQSSVLLEMSESDKAVKAVQAKKFDNRKRHDYRSKIDNRSQKPTNREEPRVDLCWNCGITGHRTPACTQPRAKCLNCQKQGHLAKFCYGKKSSEFKKTQNVVVVGGTTTEDVQVNTIRQFVSAKIENQAVNFQLDTGSDITLIGRKDWERIGKPKLEGYKTKVKSASGNELQLLGRTLVNFELKGSVGSEYVYVREHGNLLGLDWIGKSSEMSYHMSKMVNALSQTNTGSIQEELKTQFPEVFKEGLGRCTKEKAALTVNKNASPVYKPKRPVSFGAREAVEKELNRLESMNVLKKVNHSKWAAPLVCVKKAGGDLRVCADFKTGLNSALEDEDHPIPVPEDIFATLNGGRFFSTVDLKDAYLQVELSEESKELCTINTHRGLYQYQRLAFGTKTAPMVFQRIMDKMISGLDGVTAYLDDIIIVGSTEKEHKDNLFKLFSRITEYGFRVKLEKCRFLEEEIKFLGFIVDKNGRRPDEEKIRAIKNMDTPKGEKDLRSFMGMITHYGTFIPHMKSLRGPLDILLGKNVEWKWTELEEELFQKLKDTLTSDLNLTHYQPNLPVIVAADACEYGIGAVISHKMPDGTEKPIAHAAKSLNTAEKNYSQIEKEGLGLIFAVKRFHKYLYGRKFLLRTDHKPLLSIFGSKKGIPVHSQNRLVRWSTILLAYDFDIEYIKTDEFGQADALSRMIQKIPAEDEDVVIAQVELDVEDSLQSAVRKLPVTVSEIQEETEKNKVLQNVIKRISKGTWPRKVDEKLKQFNSIKDALSTVQECLMFGDRVVVPFSLQRAVLKQLHEGHPGMARMKQLARAFVYWPGLDDDVEKVVAKCNTCQSQGKTLRKVPLVPWKTPERVWQRIHVDFAGPENGQYYLVAVDAKSKWAEVKIVKTISATSTVRTLKEIFSQNGLPETIVSDNGTQFVSKEFATMCQENGIEHLRSPAFHPQSNGQAERFVDTLKRGLKKLKGEGSVSNETLSEFLLHYRSTPSTALSGISPAEAHLNRRLRTKMSLMMPQLNKRSGGSENCSMKKQFDKHHGVKARAYIKGEKVFIKLFEKNKWSWKPATVDRRKGRVVYDVVLADGRERVVHANQLKRRWNESESEETKEQMWMTTMFDIFELPCATEPNPNTSSEEEKDSQVVPTTEANIQNGTATPPVRGTTNPATVDRSQSEVHRGTVQGANQGAIRGANRGAVRGASQRSNPVVSQGRGMMRGRGSSTVAMPVPVPIRQSTRIRKPVTRFDPCVRNIVK
ncbi:hypothetical protein B9Z55_011551 [Caenorhabditis nigoni]|uniref:RNA-directed DNA polymerase n=1 Tax=Caenorhabditis nigoni TaxID=1611254 RepID=A0A2G5UKK3_9PELO|nr:hypothetical protein B9Z55_011551 [Caenorhabditis nigoni]